MTYDVVATLGPESAGEEIWPRLLEAGATAFRLNTSHLSLADLDRWISALESFFSRGGLRVPIILDLQGSKWRLGEFEPIELAPGQKVALAFDRVSGHSGFIPVPHEDFFAAAAGSGEVLMNDARVRLGIDRVDTFSLSATVIQGGPISGRKGVTLPGSKFRKEQLNEKDLSIRDRTADVHGVQYAISYVRDGREMARYRELLGPDALLIAKVERGEAVEDAAAIAAFSDAIWICRGDLGAELGLETMARAVSQFTHERARIPGPVLMAGQVLEHMKNNSLPTRSEVCHLYDLLAAGYNGIVLSDETAIGRFPAESCRVAGAFRT